VKPAAFFDLDRTLISVNSGDLWVKRERRLGRLTSRQVIEATALFLAYRLSIVDIEAAMRKALAVYRGEREETLARWTREWYLQTVAPCVTPAARQALAEHRAQGHPLVLLTSSSPYVSVVVAEQLGLDAWISSRYEVRDGLLTGEPVLPLCYGAGKVGYAERWAAEAGVDLGRSYFYTDSYTDLPMLLRVGEPRIVNPDLRLRLYARWRGWPLLVWSDPR
jgi:HAD superfamily hydrolase (TIGR01490 family)